MVRAAALVGLMLLGAPGPAVAWDPFGLGGAVAKAKEAAEEAGDHLIGTAKIAFDGIMDYFFDKKLPAFIDKVSKVASNLMDHGEKEAEILLKAAIGNVSVLVDHVVDEIEQMVNKSVQEIEDAALKALDEGFHDIMAVEGKFFSDIGTLMTRVEQDMGKVECEVQGMIQALEQFITSEINSIDCKCAQAIKNKYNQPCSCSCFPVIPAALTCHCNPAAWAQIEDRLSYEYIDCHVRRAFEDGKLSVDKVITIIQGLRTFAERARCAHVAPDGPKSDQVQFYTEVVVNISQEIYAWKNPNLNPGYEESCTGLTPFDCQQKAMKAINMAKVAYEDAMGRIAEMARSADEAQDAKAVAKQSMKVSTQIEDMRSALTVSLDQMESAADADTNSQIAHENGRITGSFSSFSSTVDLLSQAAAHMKISWEHGTTNWCDCYMAGGDAEGCHNKPGWFQVGGSAQSWTNIKCCRPCGSSRRLSSPSEPWVCTDNTPYVCFGQAIIAAQTAQTTYQMLATITKDSNKAAAATEQDDFKRLNDSIAVLHSLVFTTQTNLTKAISDAKDGATNAAAAQVAALKTNFDTETQTISVQLNTVSTMEKNLRSSLQSGTTAWCDCYMAGGDAEGCHNKPGWFQVGGSAQSWTNIKCCRPCSRRLQEVEPNDFDCSDSKPTACLAQAQAAADTARNSVLPVLQLLNGKASATELDKHVNASRATIDRLRGALTALEGSITSAIPPAQSKRDGLFAAAETSLNQGATGIKQKIAGVSTAFENLLKAWKAGTTNWCDCYMAGADAAGCENKPGWFQVGGSAQTWTNIKCCRPCSLSPGASDAVDVLI
eukprot:TRINITY_DN7733_c0_g1_i1.p1 TRINITY_DN7733_c0_g1~~TRINITY_DN7733_c0_g1_i1.p1  ORF type:complete len:854 (-),score=115.97 TRINITY_DN7733_c0_g1_i1:52-2541(-)